MLKGTQKDSKGDIYGGSIGGPFLNALCHHLNREAPVCAL